LSIAMTDRSSYKIGIGSQSGSSMKLGLGTASYRRGKMGTVWL
jgi:hypothetical protein